MNMKRKLRVIFCGCALLVLLPNFISMCVFLSAARIPEIIGGLLLLGQLLLSCVSLALLYRWLLAPVLRLNETVSSVLDYVERENTDLEGNALLEHFQLLMDREYSSHISSREAELDALQSQINPHFLYNTLECIRGQAVVEGADTISEMARSLSDYFRYSINRNEKLVLLPDEFRNVNAYIKIQNYRFSNKYLLRTHMEEEDVPILERCQLPRLTLQPIIENALLHGVRNSERDIEYLDVFIDLTESRVLIRVTDYGVGMSLEKVDEINAELHAPGRKLVRPATISGNGIALKNINERIQLIFGGAYGLRIYSTLGMGCTVEIVLPRRLANIRETDEMTLALESLGGAEAKPPAGMF